MESPVERLKMQTLPHGRTGPNESVSVTTFSYRAARSNGGGVRGNIDAVDRTAAASALIDRGLCPIEVKESPLSEAAPRASRRELAVVFQSISSLVGAGVPLVKTLALTEQLAGKRLKCTLTDAHRLVQEGESLSRALMGRRSSIPPGIVGLIAASERSSCLDRALSEVASQLDAEAELIARVRQALAYPLLLAAVGSASIVLIGTLVVPKFATLLGDLGETVPPATRWLLLLSSLATRFWLTDLIATALLVGSALTWFARPSGRLWLHRTLLALPLVGSIRMSLATARTARSLAGALSSGMPLLDAMASASDAAGDAEIAARLAHARRLVSEGETVSRALTKYRAVSVTALQLMAVGEGSGQVALMCERVARLAGADATRRINAFVAVLEPSIILVFGGAVAFVAAALLQAVYSIRPGP
jgi:general secretion pathway protein F